VGTPQSVAVSPAAEAGLGCAGASSLTSVFAFHLVEPLNLRVAQGNDCDVDTHACIASVCIDVVEAAASAQGDAAVSHGCSCEGQGLTGPIGSEE
jgi:hypothetical protein